MELWSRRRFFLTSLAGSAVAGVNKLFGQARPQPAEGRQPPVRYTDYVVAPRGMSAQGKRPLIISSANGVRSLDKGMDILKKGGDTLDAAFLEEVHTFIERAHTVSAGDNERALPLRRHTALGNHVIRIADRRLSSFGRLRAGLPEELVDPGDGAARQRSEEKSTA